MKRIKMILVDDNEAFRNVLRLVLQKQFNAEIILEASNAYELLSHGDLGKGEIVLMDIMLPDASGIHLTEQILWKYPHLKVIAMTMQVEVVHLLNLLGAGFKGCIFKNEIFSSLENALQAVGEGSYFFPKEIRVQ